MRPFLPLSLLEFPELLFGLGVDFSWVGEVGRRVGGLILLVDSGNRLVDDTL